MGHSGMEEPRIGLTPEARRRYEDNFNAIEDMEECKKRVLARCRAEKEARKRR